MSTTGQLECFVCRKPSTQRCGGCGRWAFCGREHQKLLWSAHKPQCDRSLDFFRVPPLTEEEVEGLLKLAKGGKGYGSYPFRHDKVDLVKMLKMFGVEKPNEVERHIRSVSGPDPLTLSQTRLVLCIRFFLRSYRYPPPSADFLSMSNYRSTDGTVDRTMHHMNAQSIFPFLVKVPTGEDAYDPKNKSKTKPDPLVRLRDYFDHFLCYSALVDEHEKAVASGDPAKVAQIKEWFGLASRRLQDEWKKLPKHRMLEEASPIHWHRAVFGQVEEKYFPEGYYLLTPDQRRPATCVVS